MATARKRPYNGLKVRFLLCCNAVQMVSFKKGLPQIHKRDFITENSHQASSWFPGHVMYGTYAAIGSI